MHSACRIAIAGLLLAGVCMGCSVVQTLTGTRLDAVQFAKAREAKYSEIRYREGRKLAERLQRGNPLESGDVSVQITERMLNTVAGWYTGKAGRLDESTRYVVDSTHVTLHHGCATAAVSLRAFQDTYGVVVRVYLDCLLTFEKQGQDMLVAFEPFNISPVVESTGFLAGTKSLIENIVKKKVGSMGSDFPPLRIPIAFNTMLPVNNQMFAVRDNINLDVSVPRKIITYDYAIREVLVFEEGVDVILQMNSVNIK